MADDHSDLADAMDHLATAVSNVAGSTPSGSPHAMVWVERAKLAIARWRDKFMPLVAEQPADPPHPDDAANDGQGNEPEYSDPLPPPAV